MLKLNTSYTHSLNYFELEPSFLVTHLPLRGFIISFLGRGQIIVAEMGHLMKTV